MNQGTTPKSANSQRKKPSQARSKTLVSSIYEAATRVLPKTGYEGVTTNQLAKIAGVSVGSIYQYFSNKDEIFALLLEKNLVEAKDVIDTVIQSKKDVPLEDFIADSISTVVDLNLNNQALFARLFIQAPRLNRVKKVMEVRDQFVEVLVGILKSRSQEVRPQNIELSAYTAVHAVMGVIQSVVINPPPTLDRAALKAELTDLALRYLHKKLE
jgi:AcrR family transcriptional regulator